MFVIQKWMTLIPEEGLEPPRLTAPDPKSDASTNSATRVSYPTTVTSKAVATIDHNTATNTLCHVCLQNPRA